MLRLIRGTVKILSSLKLTILLIILLSFVFLLGQWIPQKSLIGKEFFLQWQAENPELVGFLEKIGFTRIYTSFLTLFLWALFFLNLIFVMGKRFSLILNRLSIPPLEIENFSGYPNYTEVSIDRPLKNEDIRAVFKDYRVYGSPENFIAIRNRYAPLGTLIFHLSFFLLLTGGVVTTYTRFSAFLDLGEGEIFTGRLEQYSSPINFPEVGSLPEVKFLVEKIEPEIEQDIPTDLKVTIRDERGHRKIIKINQPLKERGTSFVIKNIGVAPLIIIYDQKGQEIDGAYVKLNVLKGREDGFIFHGYSITASFYPDFYLKGGEPASRSEVIRNPAFRFTVTGKGVFKEEILKRGGKMKLKGEELTWTELPYWVRFYVVKEKGLYLVYTGFAFIITALIWRLIFYRKEIRGMVKYENGKFILKLGGRAEFYRELFSDEFKKLTEDIISLRDS